MQELFIWRLRVDKPQVVILDLDVMVMDNDEAEAREGVTSTPFAPTFILLNRCELDPYLQSRDVGCNLGRDLFRAARQGLDNG